MAFISSIVNAQSYPFIQGRGSSASQVAEDRLYPKTGMEYIYKISYSQGTMPSDKAKLVGWRVEGGDTIKGNGNIPSMNIKWHKGITQGKITAYNVYDDAQKKMIEINTTVYLEDSILISQSQLNVTLLNELYFVDESFGLQYSLSNNAYDFVSIGCVGDGFVQGDWDKVNRKITGKFTTPGIKSLTINSYYRMKIISSVVKSVCVIPREIEGSDIVCSGNEEVFTIPNIPNDLGINWTLTGDVGLYLTSGQGTKTITVRSNSYGNVILNANVTYKNTAKILSKNVLANTPRVQYIERETMGTPAGSVYTGDILYLNAYPQYPPSICTYEWTISPKVGVNISSTGSTATVAVHGTGSYMVQCCVTPTCSTLPALNCANFSFNAQRRTNYKVSCNQSSKSIIVSIEKEGADALMKNSQNNKLNYELYCVETGRMVKAGLLNIEGGTIDIGDLNSAVYVLKTIEENNVETHKIIVK